MMNRLFPGGRVLTRGRMRRGMLLVVLRRRRMRMLCRDSMSRGGTMTLQIEPSLLRISQLGM